MKRLPKPDGRIQGNLDEQNALYRELERDLPRGMWGAPANDLWNLTQQLVDKQKQKLGV